MITRQQQLRATRVCQSRIGYCKRVDILTARVTSDAPTPGAPQLCFDGQLWHLYQANQKPVARPFPKQIWECLV